MVERTEAVAAEEGLLFRLGEAQRVNTVDAHRLLHLALESGGRRCRCGSRRSCSRRTSSGPRTSPTTTCCVVRRRRSAWTPTPSRRFSRGDPYADAVEQDIREAAALGATGVPFFVIDRKYGVSGAQPAEVFTQVLERAWEESHPRLEHVGGPESADACGPDGCAI